MDNKETPDSGSESRDEPVSENKKNQTQETAIGHQTDQVQYAYGGKRRILDGETTEELLPGFIDHDDDTTEKIVRSELFGKETTEAEIKTTSDTESSSKVKMNRAERRQTKREARRLAKYTEVRRQQYETLTNLLDTLTRVDDLPEIHLKQVRDAIFHADHPFLLTMVGPFSSGKSSVINALLGAKVLPVGPTPTTDHIAILRYGPGEQSSRSGQVSTIFYPSDMLQRFSLVDTPGLESVFKQHDELTWSFLHRADIVILVMIATQVLSASELNFMQNLKAYGKRLIIMVNQIDLLEPEEREQVREFVSQQSQIQLGLEPLIWLVSAKQGMQAHQFDPRDEIVWDESGFGEVEDYLIDTLDDAERVKQKLETPLQIARNSTEAAIQHVDTAQTALDEHRRIVENIEAQITAAHKERERLLEKSLVDIQIEWQGAAKKGADAIGDMFQGSRAVGQSMAGCLEIVGLGRLIRRFSKKTQAQEAFARHEVRDSLQNIPRITEKLGPALEGRDQEDIDRMVDYTRQQMNRLPDTLKNKVIGQVQTPMHYERKPLRSIRGELEDLVHKAGYFEASRIDRALRSTIVTMGLWLFIVIVIGALIATGNLLSGGGFINLILVLALALMGLGILPIRGWLLQRAYTGRTTELQNQYTKLLERAAREQIEYGTQLRRDVTAPFTRLITTQLELTGKMKQALQQHEQAVIQLQHSLSAMLKD